MTQEHVLLTITGADTAGTIGTDIELTPRLATAAGWEIDLCASAQSADKLQSGADDSGFRSGFRGSGVQEEGIRRDHERPARGGVDRAFVVLCRCGGVPATAEPEVCNGSLASLLSTLPHVGYSPISNRTSAKTGRTAPQERSMASQTRPLFHRRRKAFVALGAHFGHWALHCS